jgi:hypothetical protein
LAIACAQPAAVKDRNDERLHEEEEDEFDQFAEPISVDNMVSVDANDIDAVNNMSGSNIMKTQSAAEMRKRRTSIGDFFSRNKPSPESAKGRRQSLALGVGKEGRPSSHAQGFW